MRHRRTSPKGALVLFKGYFSDQTATVVGLVAYAKTLNVTLKMSEDANAFVIEWIANHGQKGADTKVMAHAIARSDELCKPLILDAFKGHPELIAYYTKLGFKPWAGETRQFGRDWKNGMRREPVNPAMDALKKWFGESKVVDSAGKPRVVYHGTSTAFDIFESNLSGQCSEHPTASLGFYFSSDPRVASIFSRESTDGDENDLITTRHTRYFEGANTMPVHLRIENPYMMEPSEFINMADNATEKQIRAKLTQLKRTEHDGILVPKAVPYLNAELVGDTWIAFEPTQIKSALSNGGTYDPKNPDITDGAAQRVLDAMKARSLAMLMTPKRKGKLRVV